MASSLVHPHLSFSLSFPPNALKLGFHWPKITGQFRLSKLPFAQQRKAELFITRVDHLICQCLDLIADLTSPGTGPAASHVSSHHSHSHHQLRALGIGQRPFVDIPFTSHLREIETFRRKNGATSTFNPNISSRTTSPISGAGAGGSLSGHTGSNNHTLAANGYGSSNGGGIQQQQLILNHNSSPGHSSTNNHSSSSHNNNNSDCQGYKPNAPHIQGEWEKPQHLLTCGLLRGVCDPKRN